MEVMINVCMIRVTSRIFYQRHCWEKFTCLNYPPVWKDTEKKLLLHKLRMQLHRACTNCGKLICEPWQYSLAWKRQIYSALRCGGFHPKSEVAFMNWVRSLTALGLPWIKKNGTSENCIWTNKSDFLAFIRLTGFLLFNILEVTLTLQGRCIIQSKAAATTFVLKQLSVFPGSPTQWRTMSIYRL